MGGSEAIRHAACRGARKVGPGRASVRTHEIQTVAIATISALRAERESRLVEVRLHPFAVFSISGMADQFIRAAGLLLWIVATAVQAAAAPVAPLRLDATVRPLAYDAQLTIVPTRERFLGHIEIKLDVSVTTTSFWINASRLKFKKVVLSIGKRRLRPQVSFAARDWVELRFRHPLAVGPALLAIDYTGTLEPSATSGLIKVRSGDDWYVYSRFEPTFARRAFPCFDEPTLPASWTLTLTVPILDVAISNAAQSSEVALPGMMKRVRFDTTPSVPSYGVTLAVGPLDIVDGGKVGSRGMPLRYIVPKGRAPEVRFALSSTPELVKRIEHLLNQPYPSEKLDIVAVPIASGFPATAAPGVIDLPSTLLLASVKEETNRFQQQYVQWGATELALGWFDGRRPLQWWDDMWLHEALSTWLADRVVQRFNPAWHWGLREDLERQNAMRVDRLTSTRALYQPAASDKELGDVHSIIPTEKGAAVLRMFEVWIGHERFVDVVQRYLGTAASNKARSDDFLAALTADSGTESTDLAAAFHAMAQQPGLVQLQISLDCGENRTAHPRLLLSQSRFEPSKRLAPNAVVPAAAGKQGPWTFPACFQYGQGGDFGEVCTVVRKEHQVLSLPAGEQCPDWVVGNRDGESYFLPVLSDALALQLEHAPLLPDEAIPVLGDATILSESGVMPVDLALTLAARFGSDGQAPVAAAALALARSVPATLYDRHDLRAGYARFIRAAFGARAEGLGWLPKSDEREVEGFLREDLVPYVADVGEDVSLRREADHRAREWLAGRVDLGDMRRAVLMTAAHFGAKDLFDAFYAAADKAHGEERADLYAALGAFRNPQLLDQALSLSLSDTVDSRDARTIMVQAANDPLSTPQVLRFLENHYDAIAQRYSASAPAWFVQFGRHLCDASQQQEFVNFFASRVIDIPGGAHSFAQASESAALCVATREREQDRLKSFLANLNRIDWTDS